MAHFSHEGKVEAPLVHPRRGGSWNLVEGMELGILLTSSTLLFRISILQKHMPPVKRTRTCTLHGDGTCPCPQDQGEARKRR